MPPRPLFLPIVFSLGAKVENVPLATFLGNPAKISSALRQTRGPLGTDGVACYFAAQALNGSQDSTLIWTVLFLAMLAGGEIGLDFYRDYAPHDRQRELHRAPQRLLCSMLFPGLLKRCA